MKRFLVVILLVLSASLCFGQQYRPKVYVNPTVDTDNVYSLAFIRALREELASSRVLELATAKSEAFELQITAVDFDKDQGGAAAVVLLMPSKEGLSYFLTDWVVTYGGTEGARQQAGKVIDGVDKYIADIAASVNK